MSAPAEPPVACPVLALGDRRFVRTPDLAELAMNGKPLLDDCLGPKARILAAIDNSYSMKTWWPHVSAAWNRTAVQIREQWGAAPEAVVFNRGVKQCDQSGELNESHEPGYNTDILAVVRHLRTRMEAGPAEVPVVIVFVSDGHHTAPIASGKAFQQAFEEELHEMQACRGKLGCRVNVLVVGVGPSFPTWMAMQFRTALHNGNPGLPNVFLVNDNEGVELRFAEMRDALRSCARPVAAEVPVRLNPAASPTTELFPGLWFELPEGAEQSVTVGGRRLELVESAEQQLQAMHSMFEQWVHWVDRLALAKRHEDVKAAAAQLALIMQSMLDNAHSEAKARRPANAFADRLERKVGRTSETMAQQLVRHMKEHAAGNPWQGLSDGEMAQRLSLAPDDQNRYLQKLWMRQGRPQADFPETAAAFLREVEQVRWQELEAVRHADGTLCELTQETLGESVAGPEFAAALKACPSFYTFLHCWPLAGLGVRFRYYDGVVMNPWSLEVEACCMWDKNLDTTELLGVGADAGGVEVEAGGGQCMMVNAVVPLVTPVSALPYARLVRSELFQRVVSYSVLKMPDILEPNAHPGALAGVLLHLLQLPCGDRWRDRLLDRVAATASVFAGRAALQRHIRCLQAADPRRAFCSSTAGDERPEMDGVAAQTLAKPLLLMHVMRARGQLREIRQVVPLLDAFLTEYIGRAVDCGHMQDWFELEGLRPAGEGVGLDVGAAGVALTDETYLRSFFTENDILKDVRQRMLHAQPLYSEELLAAPVRAKLAELQGLRSHSIRTAGLRGILDHFLQPCEDRDAAAAAADELLSDAAVAARMAHAVKWHGSRDRMQHRVLPWPDARRGIQETLLHNAYVERRRKLELELQEQASAAWTAEFRRLHEQNPRPLPLPEVLRQLQARRPQAARKRAGQLDYNPQTGLLRNACMVPTCPFFLQPRTDFDAHLAHLQLLPDFVPGLHRTAALLRAQPPHSIAQAVARGECLWQEGTGVPAAPSQPPEAWVASLATEYLRLEAQGVGVGEAACQPTDVLGHAGRPHRITPLP